MDDKKISRDQLARELAELRLENSSLKLQIAEIDSRSDLIAQFIKAEEALRNSEERYRTITSLTTDYIFSFKVDEDGKLTVDMISDNFPALTHRTADDISSPELWEKIVHPDDRGKLMESFHQLITQGGSVDIECRSYLPDDTMRSVRVVAHALKSNDQGSTKSIVGAVKDITANKKAEAALAFEQSLLRTLVDVLPAFVYVKDRECRFLLANIACARYMGASSPQDLIGKTDFDFYNPETAAIFRSDELSVLKGVPLLNKVEYGVAPDRSQRIVLTNKIPFHDIDGNIIGLVGASYDITELKRTEAALRVSESNLQSLINNKNQSIWSLDNNYNLIVCNDYFRTAYIAAYNVELTLGLNLIDLLSPDLREYWKPKYDLALSGEKVFFEFSETIGNSVFYFNVYLNPIMSEGNITGVSALSIDVTEHKLVLEALRESEENFRILFDASPFPTVLSEIPSGKIAFANRKLSTMLNMKPDDILGKTANDLGLLNDPRDLEKLTKLIIRQGFVDNMEISKDLPDNQTGTDLIFMRLVSMNGKRYCLTVVQDITERKRAENAIVKAREKAEQSDRLKSAFLANMGHEIRTPMNGIMGFSELLRNKSLTGEEQQQYVDIIEKSGARMLNIINDLIDLSKIEAGLMNVYKSQCNINEQTEYIYSFFKPETESKGLLFHIHNGLMRNEAFIVTDKEKLNAVLINLIKNAIKFTDKGSVEFGYTKRTGVFEFFVRDTGVGVSPEQKGIIFERFRQGSESLSRNYEGAGLGLSISKSFVEMLGGTIWMESKTGEGSSFYFTVPDEGFSGVEGFNDERPAEARSKSRNLNVLIAEDDEFSSLLITSIIKDISSKIHNSKTGREAIVFCRNNPGIDLILMDIKMPEIDGYEATRQIRSFNDKVVIIAQTSYAQTGDKEKAMEAGCNDYLPKPILKNDLLALIKKHFKDQ